MNPNLIQHATNYFGVAYYGFLALYSLYELFFGAEFVSMLVVGPIIYAFAIYGMLQLFIIPFYAVGKLLTKEKGVWNQIKISLTFGVFSLLFVRWIAVDYLNPGELHSLIEPSTLVLMLIAVIEILLRILFPQHTDKASKMNIVDRLKQVDKVYRMGLITIAGFLIGFFLLAFLYLPTDSNINGFILSVGILFGLYLVLVEWINRKLGKGHQRNDLPERAFTIDIKEELLLFQEPIIRLWPPWISVLAAILSLFLTYSFLNLTIWQIPFDRLSILAFTVVYALLAWIRWREIKKLGKETSEVLA